MPFGYYKARDDVRLRYGHWSGAAESCLGTVLVLGGRAEFVEKYLETIHELTERGFDVFSLDWRGQGLSDRLLKDPNKGYVKNYDHYVADLDRLLEKVVAPQMKRPLIVLAHSMGAHVVLRYLRQKPDIISKAVLIAPMINIVSAPISVPIARWLSRYMVHIGLASVDIPGSRWYNHPGRPFAGNPLTSDPIRFRRMQQAIRNDPRLAVSSLTHGWVAATFDSIGILCQPGFGCDISTPALVLMAGQDRVVSNRAIRKFVRQLPVHQLVSIEGARHEILQERDDLRNMFWEAFDQFV